MTTENLKTSCAPQPILCHPIVLTPEQLRGKTILVLLLGCWLLIDFCAVLSAVIILHKPTAIAVLHFERFALTAGLFYLVWTGRRWAKWLTIALFALGVLISIWGFIAAPGLLRGLLFGVFIVQGSVSCGLLAFSKSVRVFLAYQHEQTTLYGPSAFQMFLSIGAVLVLACGVLVACEVHTRKQWPESVSEQVAALQERGEPMTLSDCDSVYHALGETTAAVQHFKKAFAEMSKDRPPLMPARIPHRGRPRLPDFSTAALLEERRDVVSCLQTNAEALRLLHQGMIYDRCIFPMNLSDGVRTLMPHLNSCAQGAHLLALESLECIQRGNSDAAAASLLASLHMAEILDAEPTIVGLLIRDKILVTVCECARATLGSASISTNHLEELSERLGQASALGKRELRVAQHQRCMAWSALRGSNKEIAEFLERGPSRFSIELRLELLRVRGILQRDAEFFLKQSTRIEAAVDRPVSHEVLDQLNEVEAEVDENRDLLNHDKSEVNIISCMLLPVTIRGFKLHLWTHAYCKATIAALAVERYREEIGTLPENLEAVVPRFLAQIPKDLQGKPLDLISVTNGYAISGLAAAEDDAVNLRPGKLRSSGNRIFFRVER